MQAVRENLSYFLLVHLFLCGKADYSSVIDLLSSRLGQILNYAENVLIKAFQEGFENTFFDFHNGITMFSFINTQTDDTFFFPIWYSGAQQARICLVVSKRKSTTLLYDVLTEICSSLTRKEVDELLENPTPFSFMELLEGAR